MADNPHIRYGNPTRRGYVRVEVTPARMQVDLRAMRAVTQPREAIDTVASFVVEDGRRGAVRA
jgi:alkaline phosphatase D